MSSNQTMKVYKAKDGWRWQLWSSSDIVAESGGAYEDKDTALKMSWKLASIVLNAKFELLDVEVPE